MRCTLILGIAALIAAAPSSVRAQATPAAPQMPADRRADFLEIMPADVLATRQAFENLAVPRGIDADIQSRLFSVYRDNNMAKLDANGKIRVCFVGGVNPIREYVVSGAKGWEIPGSSLQFDFGPPGNRYTCMDSDPATIRVGFSQPGNWALVGQEALPRWKARLPTMNFSSTRSLSEMTPASRKYVIEHEFGHAIGLYHEHQNPALDCHAHMDWQVVRRELTQAPYHLTDDVIDRNFARLNQDRLRNSTPDDQSVMLYALPEDWFHRAAPVVCYSAPESPISREDQATIRAKFPIGLEAYFAVRNAGYRKFVDTLANVTLSPLERHDAEIVAGSLTPFPTGLAERKLQYEAATIEKLTRVMAGGLPRQ